jgi:hypothetical protein
MLGQGASYSATRTLTLGSGYVAGGISGSAVTTWNGPVVGPGTFSSGYAFCLTNPSNSQTSNFLASGSANGAVLVVADPLPLGVQDSTNRIFGQNHALGLGCGLRVTGTGEMTFPQRYDFGGCYIDVTDASAVVNWTGPMNNGATNVASKRGPGALVVTDWNVTTSDLDVQEGAFYMNDTTTSNLASFTVRDGALLGGTGTMNLGAGETVTVDAGGAIAPGMSAGTLTMSGGNGLVLNGTAADPFTYYFELGSTSGSDDLIAVAGTIDFSGLGVAGAAVLDIDVAAEGAGRYFPSSTNLPVFTYTTENGFNDGNWLFQTSHPKVVLVSPSLSDGGDGTIYLTGVELVPEPGTIGLLALGLITLVRRRRA